MTLVDTLGIVVTCTFAVRALFVFDQAIFCHSGRRLLHLKSANEIRKNCSWEAGTEGLSALKWVLIVQANLLWLVYGVCVADKNIPVIIGAVLMISGGLFLLSMMLVHPPRRRTKTKVAIWSTWIVSLATVTCVTSTSSATDAKMVSIITAFPILSTFLFQLPGQVHQVCRTISLRHGGKQTLLECGWTTFDYLLWIMYGLILGRPELWSSSLIMAIPFTLQFLFLSREKMRKLAFEKPSLVEAPT